MSGPAATSTDLVPVELPPGHASLLADVKPPERLSATTLRAHSRCLLSGYFAREASNPSSLASTAGSIAHEVCAQVAFQARVERKETFTPDEVEAVAMRVLVKPEEPNPLPPETLTEVIMLVRKWAMTAYFPINAPHYEVEISARHQIGGETLSGRIDLRAIDGPVAEITDYKFGRLVPTQAEFESSVQLPTYAVYTAEDHPEVDTFVLREIYPRASITRQMVLDREAVARHKRWLEITAQRVRAAWAVRAFPPTPGAQCRYCSNPSACPLPESARPESIDTYEQAQAQLGALIVEKARVKLREKAMRPYLERQREDIPEGVADPGVAAGDAHASLKIVETKRFDRKAAERAGLDLSPFDKPSSSRKLLISGT